MGVIRRSEGSGRSALLSVIRDLQRRKIAQRQRNEWNPIESVWTRGALNSAVFRRSTNFTGQTCAATLFPRLRVCGFAPWLFLPHSSTLAAASAPSPLRSSSAASGLTLPPCAHLSFSRPVSAIFSQCCAPKIAGNPKALGQCSQAQEGLREPCGEGVPGG